MSEQNEQSFRDTFLESLRGKAIQAGVDVSERSDEDLIYDQLIVWLTESAAVMLSLLSAEGIIDGELLGQSLVDLHDIQSDIFILLGEAGEITADEYFLSFSAETEAVQAALTTVGNVLVELIETLSQDDGVENPSESEG